MKMRVLLFSFILSITFGIYTSTLSPHHSKQDCKYITAYDPGHTEPL